MKDTLNKTEHRVHELENSPNTVPSSASKGDEAGKALKRPEEHVQYLENLISDQANQLHCTDTAVQSRDNKVLALQKQVPCLPGELSRSETQNVTDKDLSERLWTALAMYNVASYPHISIYVSKLEKLETKRASLYVVLRKYRNDSDSEISRFRKILEDEKKCADEKAKGYKRPLVIEKGVKPHLRHRANDSNEPEDSYNKLNGAISKQR